MKQIIYLSMILIFLSCTNPMEVKEVSEEIESEVSTNTNISQDNTYQVVNNTTNSLEISSLNNQFTSFTLEANCFIHLVSSSEIIYNTVLINGIWCGRRSLGLVKTEIINNIISLDSYNYYYRFVFTYNNGYKEIIDSDWDSFPGVEYTRSRDSFDNDGIDLEVYYKDVLVYSGYDRYSMSYSLIPNNYEW